MHVVLRSGVREPVSFDKITKRITGLAHQEPTLPQEHVDPVMIAQKVHDHLVDPRADSSGV